MQSNLLYVVQSNRVEFNCSGSCSFYVESEKSLWLSSESRMTPSGQTTSFKTEALNTFFTSTTSTHKG